MASHGAQSGHEELGKKGYSPPGSIDSQEQLRNVLTNTMTMSPELFERMYLAPKNNVSGDLRKKFANPTPLALTGLAVGLLPLSASFMGWRGAGGFAVATTTTSIWFGGMLLCTAALMEFILGNTFPMMIFFSYGSHFLVQATVFIPWFNAIGYYAEDGLGGPKGVTPEFAASFGFYALGMTLISVIFLLGSLRTNFVFVLIFIFASIGFGLGTGGFWHIALGNMVMGTRLLVGLGYCFFGCSMCGFYLLLSVTIITMELPIPDLPVGDLSTLIKPRSRVKQD